MRAEPEPPVDLPTMSLPALCFVMPFFVNLFFVNNAMFCSSPHCTLKPNEYPMVSQRKPDFCAYCLAQNISPGCSAMTDALSVSMAL